MEKLNELDDLVLLVNSKNNPFDNYSTVNDKSILAIAKAFRALAQRAEAAGAKLAELEKKEQPKAVVRHYTGCKYPVIKVNSLEVVIAGDREDAEELAEYINSIRPAPAADHVSVQEAWEACGGNPGIKATREELLEVLRLMDEAEDEVEAATPAADLAELVPDERTAEYYYENYPQMAFSDVTTRTAEWNACRAAILRNIQEAK